MLANKKHERFALFIFLSAFVLASLIGCQAVPPASNISSTYKASWEKYPENKPWTDFTFNLISGELFGAFDKASDATAFCPKYASLSHDQKAAMWTEVISQVALYESKWDPADVFNEPAPLNYPSIGLLQLSYEDHAGYSFCPAKGSKDLKDPLVNLDCGIRILANQVNKRGALTLSSGVYWSTLKIGGKYSQIPKIQAATKKVPGCQ